MDKIEIINNAKHKVDRIYREMEALKVAMNHASGAQKEHLRRLMEDMSKSKETLGDLYDSLQEAREDSFQYLKNAFDQMSAVMSKRISSIKKSSKTLMEV